ncbi:MAG: ABC transporter substrate-binding protein [Acidobacteriota bacterium]
MQIGKGKELRAQAAPRWRLTAALLAILACTRPATPPAEVPVRSASGETVEIGHSGGRLVVALSAEPLTLNPVLVTDLQSRAIVHRMTANLVHIDRRTQEPVAALAESWETTPDGRRITLQLRPGLRFSDGHPATADDVLFSFEVYLDEAIGSPERALLRVGGVAPDVRRIDDLTVEVELAEPYAAGERLFDGIAILPRHRLEPIYRAGHLRQAWGLDVAPQDIAGLGPFRLSEVVPGERLVLERNPFYWRSDAAGQPLPYLDKLVFLFVAKEAQTLRLMSGDLDIADRISPADFALLNRQASQSELQLADLGAGLDLYFLFFNLNDLTSKGLPNTADKQRWFRQLAFRRAMRAAIDVEGLVRLVFQGRATPLAALVSPGSRDWPSANLVPPKTSLEDARRRLAGAGFGWDDAGRLHDDRGQRVELSLLTVASRPEMTAAATVIQEDLRPLGVEVRVAALSLGAVSERLLQSFDYELCLIALGGGSGGPNPMVSVLTSSGSNHFWRLGQAPEGAWQAEIDRLMDEQRSTLDLEARRERYHRVQELVAENLPVLSLVSPNVLVGARSSLGNFRPAVLPHHTLWNAEELFWRPTGS